VKSVLEGEGRKRRVLEEVRVEVISYLAL